MCQKSKVKLLSIILDPNPDITVEKFEQEYPKPELTNGEFMKKYTMTLSKKQLEIMEEALHSYARMHVGQLTTALESITFWHSDVKDKLNETQQKWLDELTLYEHNQMHGHTEESEIAWDIYQVLRHQLWKESPNRIEHSVADSVYKRGVEELPELEVEDV